jgi:4-amino-4-deoxy-L-arabinose transferase-like glycosyltransferase
MLKLRKYLPYFLVLAICSFPVFGHLDSFPIQLWDESRLATNAYEMYKSNDLIVTTFQGRAESVSTKPPLMVWSQFLCMKLLGVSELSVRLPSALAAIAIMLWTTFFFGRIGINRIAGILFSVMLLSSPGFNGEHGMRFGDRDTMLSFFILLQVTAFYLFSKADRKNSYQFYLVFIMGVVGAVLTKGVAGLFLTPIFVFWAFRFKSWQSFSVSKLIIPIISGLLIIASYYVLREFKDPGYLKSVYHNELFGRYFGDIENHVQPWDYYLKLFPSQTNHWLFLIVPITIIGFSLASSENRELTLFLITAVTFYFAVIQFSSNKIFWYSMPIFPILYAFTTILFVITVRKLGDLMPIKWDETFILIPVILLTALPYSHVLRSTYNTTERVDNDNGLYNVTNFLRNCVRNPEPDKWKFIDSEYSANNMWYIQRLNDQGYDIRRYMHLDSIQPGDKVLLRQEYLKDSICSPRVCEMHHAEYSCWFLTIGNGGRPN